MKLGVKSIGFLVLLFIVFGVSMFNIDGQKEIDEWQNEPYTLFTESHDEYSVVDAVIVDKMNTLSVFATGEELWWKIKYTSLEGVEFEGEVLRDFKNEVGDTIEIAYRNDTMEAGEPLIFQTRYVENPIIGIYKTVLAVSALLATAILVIGFINARKEKI